MPQLEDKTFEEQLTKLFARISVVLDVPIVYGLQVYDKPKYPNDYPDESLRGQTRYPFIGYTFQSVNRVANIKFTEQNVDNVYTWWEEQYEFTVSLTCISPQPFESVELATSLHGWITDTGADYLMANNIALVSTSPILPRDFMLVNDYERRNGFDARLRMARVVDHLTPRIEIVNIPEGTIIQ